MTDGPAPFKWTRDGIPWLIAMTRRRLRGEVSEPPQYLSDEESEEALLQMQIAHGIVRCTEYCSDPEHARLRAEYLRSREERWKKSR